MDFKKKVTILGSTGSIGTQALEVVEKLEGEIEVLGLACAKNIEKLRAQIKKFKPKMVCVSDYSDAKVLESEFPEIKVVSGDEGLLEIATNKEADMLLTATNGKAGLKPTIEAIKCGIDIALANKETLVMAGDIVMPLAKKHNVKVLPVDSEHSAIFQCSDGKFNFVEKIVITASGGPFLNWEKEKIETARVQDALNHPNWSMGKKITIDSATLMNKGLEVIEAHHLFGIPYNKIDVVVHPQSIIHSAVEYKDGSTLAQLGNPSMHIPIQYAFTYPTRLEGIESKSFSFLNQTLTFFEPNLEKFPCLSLAFNAGEIGGTMPVVLNAANEVAVGLFLESKINILDIACIVEREMSKHNLIENPTLDEIFMVDEEIRKNVIMSV
ncbi:1-deoxy-D-xylulose-5-phosphate reductoisomerase [bacterium]|nr:1-deoxy-D-xylulose-5-phosphate reductoisomerase [bacterium]